MTGPRDIIRRENIFYADGKELRTLKDFFSYIETCDEMHFSNNVNDSKNDFASWISGALLHKKLAEDIRSRKSLGSARDAARHYSFIMDKLLIMLPKEKFFNTAGAVSLTNLYDLFYFVSNCEDGNYAFHVNDSKNDFANWVGSAFNLSDLSAVMKKTNNRQQFRELLARYLDDALCQDPGSEKPKADEKPRENVILQSTTPSEKDVPKVSKQDEPQETKDAPPVQQPEKNDHSPPKKEEPSGGLKQYEDQELEKFVKFVKPEEKQEDVSDIEFLKTALKEIKAVISQLYKDEKNPFIPDLLTRAITSKIEYYAVTKNKEDYDRIMMQLKEIQNEIEYCRNEVAVNIADEMLHDLEFQKILLKKKIDV
jgi:hypothetical protein